MISFSTQENQDFCLEDPKAQKIIELSGNSVRKRKVDYISQNEQDEVIESQLKFCKKSPSYTPQPQKNITLDLSSLSKQKKEVDKNSFTAQSNTENNLWGFRPRIANHNTKEDFTPFGGFSNSFELVKPVQNTFFFL